MESNAKSFVMPFVLVAAGLLALMAIVQAGFLKTLAFDFNLSASAYAGLLTHIVIITVIVERLVELYNGVFRMPARKAIQTSIAALGEDLSINIDERNALVSNLNTYKSITRKRTMCIGFFIGILIALAGVNTLGVLFDARDLDGNQYLLFKTMDIVVTAGIIAGGSDGVNNITAVMKSRIEALRKPTAVTAPNVI